MNPTAKKWMKIGGIVFGIAGLTVGGIFAGRKIKRNIDIRRMREDDMKTDANVEKEQPTLPNNTNVIPSVNYKNNSIYINGVEYKFDKSGIKKIQQYMSKNAAFKAEIDRSGGIDGKIGDTFLNILVQIIKTAAKTVNPFGKETDWMKYATQSIQTLAQKAGLTSGEIKIS